VNSAQHNPVCGREETAAYLDGELDSVQESLFEKHLESCDLCARELLEQRRLLCTLDIALGDDPAVQMPHDFARIVATHAQSDMSGVRTPAEHGLALRLCAGLVVVCFVLLGAAMKDLVLAPARLAAGYSSSLLNCSSRAVCDAGTGATVIVRGLASHLILGSFARGAGVLLLIGGAVILLPHSIRKYHRGRTTLDEGADKALSP
jgi:anti-sigma factor RsiW